MNSYYLEAHRNPGGLGIELSRRLIESPIITPSINKILIRSRGSKSKVLQGLLSRYYEGVPVGFLPSEWDEGAHKGSFIPEQKIAAYKATAFNPEVFFEEAKPEREGWILSLATDVHQHIDSAILDKPTHISSKEDMINYLFTILGGNEVRKFKASSSTAVLAKDARYPSERGRGLVSKENHHFVVSPFTREEIEFYLYGVEGMNGSYPNSLDEILQRLVSEYQLRDDELQLLRQGLTMEEIFATNGGLRWLHPLFEHHITLIDGVRQGDEGFELKLNSFFLSLMGSSRYLPLLIGYSEHPKVWSSKDRNGSKNLYRSLRDDWREVVFLDRGDVVVLQSMTADDIPEVSLLTTANLLNGTNHSVLTDEQRSAYAAANSPEEFERTFLNDRNRFTLVVRSSDGGLVGYVLTRELKDDPNSLEIRRIHTSKNWQRTKGIGALMLERIEDYARENSFPRIMVDASGNSQSFFARHGFITDEVVITHQGVFENLGATAPKVTRMRKII